MNPAHLKRVFDLVRSTAEHVIISDAQTSDVFVVMHLDEYEQLVASSECQNRELESQQESDGMREIATQKISSKTVSSFQSERPGDHKGVMVEDSLAPEQLYFNDQSWKADWESEFLAEHPEVMHAEDDENTEERFYIEPLE
jgi:hypothetical protein